MFDGIIPAKWKLDPFFATCSVNIDNCYEWTVIDSISAKNLSTAICWNKMVVNVSCMLWWNLLGIYSWHVSVMQVC